VRRRNIAASPAGAAWTEFAATAPVMAVTESVTPFLVKKSRNFSTPRFTRIRAASSSFHCSADLIQFLAVKKSEHNGVMLFFPQTTHCSSSNGAI